MAEFDICAYGDTALHGGGTGILENNGTLTGHHIIPDHCFFYTGGMRGKGDLSAFLCPGVRGYRDSEAPVILLTADHDGGKSRHHGLVHAWFDPIEMTASLGGNEWTYADARAAAADSIAQQFPPSAATIEAALDAYFVDELGLDDDTVLRAGERGTMKSAPPPRRSARGNRHVARSKYAPAKAAQRFKPY